ncbi:MAG: 30S ribosomal protein S12 methylthiotransferase RimO [Candidatus Jordarchaeaceae archaeon]
MHPDKKRAAVIALGCPKNRVDSEYILGSLAFHGYELTSFPSEADLLVLTTCAYIKSAVEESENAIRKLIRLKRVNPFQKVVVAGCLVQRYKKKFLVDRFPEIDHWVGLNDILKIPEIVDNLPTKEVENLSPPPRVISTLRHYAYLKIADGCDNHCSFCLLPKIRGPFRSRPIEEILEETHKLAELGVKELILVAQDTTLYGIDIYNRIALGKLIDELSRIKYIHWIRIMYAHPAHLSEDVIEQFGSNPKLCRYIDLPIQHISDEILSMMNRGYTRRDVERLLARLRTIPEMRIRTTVMTGFPGEREKDFNDLLEFIRYFQFDRLSGYIFSPEDGTRAKRMRCRIPSEIAQRRLNQIMQIQKQISRNKLSTLIGKEIPLIVDFPGIGRTEWDAPEIDGVVKIKRGRARAGSFINARILSASTYDLTAVHLKKKRPYLNTVSFPFFNILHFYFTL